MAESKERKETTKKAEQNQRFQSLTFFPSGDLATLVHGLERREKRSAENARITKVAINLGDSNRRKGKKRIEAKAKGRTSD